MQRSLSEKYKNRIRPLVIDGVVGFVWKKELLLSFLDDEESDNYAILGGDVIRVNGDKMEYTYDSWGIAGERDPAEPFYSYVRRCKAITRDYLFKYPDSDDILFSPVMTSEVTAGLLK